MNFQGKSFLKTKDFSKEELNYLIDLAIHLKRLKKERIPHPYLKDQRIALIFEKTSTRTRAAFTVAALDLGASVEFLGAKDLQLGKKESVEDTAKVLGSMFDGFEFRGYSQEMVEDLAKFSGVPVWNGLTDMWHPTQMIADFMTVKEEFGRLEGLQLTYIGDGRNNVAHSLLICGAILGVNITIASPKSLQPSEKIIRLATEKGKESGARIYITEDPVEGVKNADVLYTDVWISMGEEGETAERIKLLKDYQVNSNLVSNIEKDYIFLHCLPANHDLETEVGQEIHEKYGLDALEVRDDVFRSEKARQFQQAENRLHSIKSIMAATNGNLFIPTK